MPSKPTAFNKRLQLLERIATAAPRRIIGLMSGTSLDGLDLVLCEMTGVGTATQIQLRKAALLPYSDQQKGALQALVSKEQTTAADVAIWNAQLAAWHAKSVLRCLQDWNESPDSIHCLASHGQTIWHAPHSWQWQGLPRHATLQIGDGDHLALHTGILTVSDFRQKAVAAGGEGAPLATFAEMLICRGSKPRILLNLGGIANYSWLPPLGVEQLPRYGDTGPANALIDRAVRHLFPESVNPFDANGKYAAAGKVHPQWLTQLKKHPYFQRKGPKSTGPELFGDHFLAQHLPQADAMGLSAEDLMATLTRFSAETIADTLRAEIDTLTQTELYVSGGGVKNPVLCGFLKELLPELHWQSSAALGLDSDYKEAILFAVFANEMLCGQGLYMAETAIEQVGLGKISFPF